jgi:hypothetical protein
MNLFLQHTNLLQHITGYEQVDATLLHLRTYVMNYLKQWQMIVSFEVSVFHFFSAVPAVALPQFFLSVPV